MKLFYDRQAQTEKDLYKRLLGIIGSLSRLFSDGNNPHVDSRVAENLFCKAFSADNVSRTDLSADAKKGGYGIGIKTFLHNNGKTWQKIAEFNRAHRLFSALANHEKILKISELRNDRLLMTQRTFNTKDLIYHLITRSEQLIRIFETEMPLIQIDKIQKVEYQAGNVLFHDELESYKFNISKSTLYKRFFLRKELDKLEVDIFSDPYSELYKISGDKSTSSTLIHTSPLPFIVLPLYSERGDKHVPEKSGLNQWNASGRSRDANEAYIAIPAWIHKKFPRFFPFREVPFELVLPNKEVISASVCQDGSKALMSNPNSKLGSWLLRQVLNLPEGKLVTYEKLLEVDIDSVTVRKISSSRYEIDFSEVGTFQAFEEENNI
jgi:hypothetical protein